MFKAPDAANLSESSDNDSNGALNRSSGALMPTGSSEKTHPYLSSATGALSSAAQLDLSNTAAKKNKLLELKQDSLANTQLTAAMESINAHQPENLTPIKSSGISNSFLANFNQKSAQLVENR